MNNVHFTWNGGKITRAAQNAMKKKAHEGMEAVLTETIPKTPKDEGELRDSGHVVPATATQIVDDVKVVFDAPHAIAQHEGYRTDPRTGQMVNFRNYQEPGTGPKFLEDTFNQMKARVLDEIAFAVRQAMKAK